MQQLASWMIRSLPSVRSEMHNPRAVAGAMKSMGSTAGLRQDVLHLCEGQTTWAWTENGMLCAIGWDWIEIMPGVPVLADPMNIITNAVFMPLIGEENTAFCASETVSLNSVVHLLPWQPDVLSGIAAGRTNSRRAHGVAGRSVLRLAV